MLALSLKRFRGFPVVLYCVFVSLTSVTIVNIGWTAVWKFLGIPSMTPIFADMRTIQGAIASSSQGLNPQITNPGDPWGRTMNYPEIWIQIARTLHFQSEVNFILWNLIVVVFFLLACIYVLRKSPDFMSLIVICSTSTLLAIERGNNDLIVFSLLMGTLVVGGISGRIFLLISIVVKIYPAFVVPFLSVKKKEKIILILATTIYLIALHDQLKFISSGNSAGGPLSYGIKSTAVVARDYLLSFFGFKVALVPILIVLILFILVTLFPAAIIVKREIVLCDVKTTDMFLFGSVVYCFTFIFSANWDYRLIFLIFCLPWIKVQDKQIRLLILSLIIISSNYLLFNLVFPNIVAVLITTLAKYILFSVMAVTIYWSSLKKVKVANLKLTKAK